MKIYAVRGKFSSGFQRVFFDKGELEAWWEDYADSHTSYTEYDVPDPDYEEQEKVWCITIDLNTDTVVDLYRGCAKNKEGKMELWPKKYPYRISFYIKALTSSDVFREAKRLFKEYKDGEKKE